MSDCLFCTIAAGGIPADIVLETDTVLAFRDISPRARVHVLVVPRAHHETAAAMAAADPAGLAAMVQLHCTTPLRLCQAVLPGMLARRAGTIVNVASVAAFVVACVGAWLGIGMLDSWILGVVLAVGCATSVPFLSPTARRPGRVASRRAADDVWDVSRLSRGLAITGVVLVAAAAVGVALGFREGDLAVFAVAVGLGTRGAAIGPLRR